MSQTTDVISGCNHCWPFHNTTNNGFETLCSANRLSDMDKLCQLRFNPFELNQNTALSDNNSQLDSYFDTSKIQCDYFLPQEFKKRIKMKICRNNFRCYI